MTIRSGLGRWGWILLGSHLVTACGGMPFESKDFEGVDMDGDGYARFNELGAILDCNDLDPEINPSATDDCDGLDSNCNGIIDDQGPYYYADRDGDGYGRPDDILRSCERPDAYVTEPTDCDDDDASRSPGVIEVCDGKDNDCNNLYDDIPAEGAPAVFYYDADGDEYGDAARPVGSCDPDMPPVAEVVEDNTDCHDDDRTAYPGSTAFEITGDGIDQDCDGTDACTDLDCDGIADVVVGWADDMDLPWLEGDAGSEKGGVLALVLSDGRSVGARVDTRGPDGHTSGYLTSDVNQDGYLDVVQSFSRDEVGMSSVASYVHFGPFASSLPGSVTAPGESLLLAVEKGMRLAVGDFNGSGVMDVVVGAPATATGEGGTAVFVDVGAVGGGSEALEPDFSIVTEQVHALASHDLDQDGFDDLLVCHGPAVDAVNGFLDDDLLLFFGGPDGLSEVVAPTTGCLDLAVGDLDADAQLEILVVRGFAVSGGVESAQLDAERIDLADDRTTSITTVFDTPHAGSVQLVDVDGDSDLDVVFGGGPLVTGVGETEYSLTWETEIQVHLNMDGAVPVEPDLDLAANGARPLFGDFNSDGELDLVAPGQVRSGSGASETVFYRGTGDATVFDEDGGDVIGLPPWLYGDVLQYQSGDDNLDIIATGADDGFGLKVLVGSPAGPTEDLVVILGDLPVSLIPPLVVQ